MKLRCFLRRNVLLASSIAAVAFISSLFQLNGQGESSSSDGKHTSPSREEMHAFADTWMDGVLAIRILHTFSHRHPIRTAVVIATVPLGLNVVLLPLAGDFSLPVVGAVSCQEPPSLTLMAGFSVLAFFLFLFPYATMRRSRGIINGLHSFLNTDDNRTSIVSSWKPLFRIGRQITLSFLALAGALVATSGLRSAVADSTDFCPSLILSISLVAFLGMNSVYWLWSGVYVVRTVARCDDLDVYWFDPASTPAIRLLSRLLGYAGLLASLGLVATFLPSAYFSSETGNHPFTVTMIWLLGVIGLATVVGVVFLPQFWLSRLIGDEKAEVMRSIAETIRNSGDDPIQERELVETFHLVRQAPDSALYTEPIINYTAALLGALIPIAWSWIARSVIS